MDEKKTQACAEERNHDVQSVKTCVEEERAELQSKAERLQKFTTTEAFKTLPYAQRRLLMEQFNIMASYIDCLSARLSIM